MLGTKMTGILLCMVILALGFFVIDRPAFGAPIFGETPRTQFFLGTAFRTFSQFQEFETGGNELDAWVIPAIGSYAFLTDATVTLMVPYVDKHFKTPERTFKASGIGDILLLGKYTFYRRDLPFGRDHLAVIGDLKLPTGSTSEGPGIKAAPPLQLGSGGVDGIVGLAAGTSRSWYSIETALLARIDSEAKDVRFGNALLYDLYLAYQIYPRWPTPFAQLNLSIEFNGRTFRDDEIDGKKMDTGGTVLFISPGIQYIVRGDLLFESGIQIPIIRNVGSQGLKPGLGLLFGLRYLF